MALLSGCSSAVPVAVSNNSTASIQNVVISGTGFSQAIPIITPGATVTTRVHPRGESGIAVAFSTNSRRIERPQQGYVEGSGNYSATVTINPDLSVSVAAQLGPR
jgi:hypothetical protein